MVEQPSDESNLQLPVQAPGLPGLPTQGAPVFPREFEREPEGSLNWRRYMDAVLRRKWLVGLATVLGVAGGYAATRFSVPVYSTEATVWIETQASTDQTGPIRQGQLLESFAWIDLLKSFEVLDQAVRDLRLYAAYPAPDSGLFRSFDLKERFVPGRYELRATSVGDSLLLLGENGAVLERVAVGDSVGLSVGFAWAPGSAGLRTRRGRGVPFSVTSPREVARGLGIRLDAGMRRQDNFLRVSLSGSNPHRITATVNAVLDRFVEVAAELKRRALTEKAAFLEEQLTDAERNLRESEQLLRDFQIRTITLPSQRASPIAPGLELTQDPVLGNFFAMQLELDALRRDREAIVRGLAQAAEASLAVEAFEAIAAVQSSAEFVQALSELTDKRVQLRALRYRYTDEYGPVRRLADQIRDLEEVTIPGLAQALVAELSTRERALDNELASASTDMRQIPARAIEEARLARDVDIAETLYTSLQQRFEEARLAEMSSIPDVRVLDEAVVPVRPTSAAARNLLMLGFIGGLGVGVIGAVLLDRVDRRVRYPEQVTDEMGLPILGVIPHLSGLRNGRRPADSAPVIEALRGVRLNVVNAYGSAGPVVVTITSPGAGDGKSFVASNLALAFADAGHRTLLIDGDSRRGSLHRVFAAARKPGLTDCLAGRVQAGTVVQKTEYPLLHFLGGGTRMSRAPELLGSPQMVQLLTEFRSGYAVIIIDSPPLGAGVDAYTLGTVSGNLVVVLKTGATNRDESEAKLDLLDRLPVRILGAVLNGVKDQRAYGYKYYSYYMPGYEHEMEEEDRLIKGAG